MKEVTVTFVWNGHFTFEVPDDWTMPDTLNGFTPEQLEEVSPVTAELVDWGACMNWEDWMDLARVYEAGASKSTELGNSALGEVMEAMADQARRIGQARAQVDA